jgi:hypothetical protein
MSILSAIKRGTGAVQSAYAKQKVAAEKRADTRMAKARTKMERERIKIGLEREKLALQRELLQAKAAVQREKAAVKAERAELARRKGSPFKSLSRGLSAGYDALDKFYNRPAPRRTVTTRKRRVTKRSR